MKIKNKGKVYPSPSSSSSSSAPSASLAVNREKDKDFLSVFSLVPAAILALASILSLEDREVLAYMITRSLKTTTTSTSTATKSPSSLFQESKKKSSKKPSNNKSNNNSSVNASHKAPMFDCDCFNCYTSYWFRWDSSPNRERIHQVIEAFEEHLSNGEQSRKTTRGKRRDRTGKKPVLDVPVQPEMPVPETAIAKSKSSFHGSPDEEDISPAATAEIVPDGVEEKKVEPEGVKISEEATPEAETSAVAEVALSNHKSLARKVLPDVLGLLNSRLWSLWSPNV